MNIFKHSTNEEEAGVEEKPCPPDIEEAQLVSPELEILGLKGENKMLQGQIFPYFLRDA